MRWIKRLKWMRASKIIIPIALAISLVFAGFSVYAREAEYFVIRINEVDGISLALAMQEDMSDQTPRLLVPIDAGYEDATWTPNADYKYDPTKTATNLPNDIAQQTGVHSLYETKRRYSFFSFSFYVINNSDRAVDIDMRINIDSLTVGSNTTDNHLDDALRVMLIEGRPLLSDPDSYVIYKKREKTPEIEQELTNTLKEKNGYDNSATFEFESRTCVMERAGELAYKNVGVGKEHALRFTIVMWLEGWDPECIDPIRGETLKMSIDFTGY